MIKIGIICPSDIALRRFMPALMKLKDKTEYIGIAIPSAAERFDTIVNKTVVKETLSAERAKAQKFVDQYGGKIFESYNEIICSNDIDAIYVPLPPALHFEWAKKALENGKHVLVEKPSTTSFQETLDLIEIAKKKRLALHENYMFVFHDQLDALKKYVEDGNIGDVRLYRISFGFPKRNIGDFRYIKSLGGGALIDAGGYTIKYASMLLGETTKVLYSKLNYTFDYDVDIYGSGALGNDNGDIVQVSFGMDNEYRCELEVWGSKGLLTSGRVLTAPAGFVPSMTIKKEDNVKSIDLPADDTFFKSISYFLKCISNDNTRNESYEAIEKQAMLFDEFLNKAN